MIPEVMGKNQKISSELDFPQTPHPLTR